MRLLAPLLLLLPFSTSLLPPTPTSSRHSPLRCAPLPRGGESPVPAPPSPSPTVLPRFDSLDRKILLISLPAILNFAINPLVGAIDLFWVGRMSSALALAGQAAANQVYSSAFWMISFLPSVTTPLIAKHYAAGDELRAQDTLRQALFLAALLGAAGSAFLLLRSDLALSAVLAEGSPALEFARP